MTSDEVVSRLRAFEQRRALPRGETLRVARGDRLSVDKKLQGLVGPDESREPLRSPPAWYETERDFGKAKLRLALRNAVVARECHFDATAKRCSVQCDYDGVR